MDREKINEAAWEYHKANRYEDNPYRADIMDAFGNGANWLMQQPLANRLTEEEKEKIKAKYNELKSLNSISNEMFADDTAILECLFGEEFFEKGE